MGPSAAKPERVSLGVPRDTYFLGLIRKTVVELARRVGFGPEATAEIEMAVDEACSNAIRHALPGFGGGAGAGLSSGAAGAAASATGGGTGTHGGLAAEAGAATAASLSPGIALEATAERGHGITIILSDGGGRPFPFDRYGNSLDLDAYFAERQAGGLGVYIIKRFMDEVQYTHRPEVGNELKMVKYIHEASSRR